MAKIIILNAPAGAGKDTIGNILTDYPTFTKAEFKQPMFETARGILGEMRYEKFLELYNNRETKEVKAGILGNKSPRELMIWISEDVVKPVFGNGYFGYRMAELATDLERKGSEAVIVTDGGFKEEIIPLLVCGHEVVICRLHRDGYSFDGDSRNYINLGNYHKNYKEQDYILVDGDPYHTVNQIVSDHIK